MRDRSVEGFRLSVQQKRVWQLQRESHASRAQCAVLIEGPLDAARLRDAALAAAARHEILRTTFHRRPGQRFPYQVIESDLPPSWAEIDPAGSEGRAGEGGVEDLFREELSRAFDLERGPLARLTLLRLAERRHVLLVGVAALCADTRSLRNFVGELARGLDDGARGGQTEGETVQYADYCAWQSDTLGGDDEDAAQAREFWGREDWAALTYPVLPSEGASRPRAGFEPESLSSDAGAEIVREIEGLARRTGTSAEAVLLACWQSLLRRLSNRADILTLCVSDRRSFEELSDALGLLAHRLPIVTRFKPGHTFLDLVGHTHRALAEATQWGDFSPAAEAQEGAANAPVGFEFAEWPARRSGDASFTLSRHHNCAGRFKLELACVLCDDQLRLDFRYDPTYYAADEIARLAALFGQTLRGALASPSAPVEQLPVGGDEARREVTPRPDTAGQEPVECVHRQFERQAERTPERVAVVSATGRLTFAELNARANQLAHLLRRRGVGPDAAVGLCVGRSAEMLVALLGILKAGGAYVPLEPDMPAPRLSHQLREARPLVLVTQEDYRPRFADFTGAVICLDTDARLFEGESQDNPAPLAAPQHLAYVIYTSGSTGTPKGAAITHEGLANYTNFICGRLGVGGSADGPAMNFAHVSTLSADLGNTCLFPPLVGGGCLHVIDYETATDAEQFAGYVSRQGIDVLKITPTHLNALLCLPQGRAALPRKYLVLGGEALSFGLAGRIAELSPECEVINHYGPTETTVGSLTHGLAGGGGARPDSAATVPIGRPIENTRAYVLDENLGPVAPGVAGELYIAGRGLARGYLGHPAQTAARFIPDPSGEAGARMYRTGDRARYLADGGVEFLGRSDDQVKIRGFRVELGEVEVVLKRHEEVRDAVVLAAADEAGHKHLTAYVVTAAHQDAQAVARLRGFAREQLPEYMIPQVFVMLDELPLTPNGKIDRAALSSMTPTRPETGGDTARPGNAAEEALGKIWAEVLGVGSVGMHDNFFELGGDSILGIQIVAKANQAGFQLTPKHLFQYQTVAELAAAAGSPAVQVQQGPVAGPVVLTPSQRRFFEQELPHPDLFSQAMVYEVWPAPDADALARVVNRLLAHHDALRLRFTKHGGQWEQVNLAAEEHAVFSTHDLSQLTGEEQEARFREAADELRARISLSEGPLIRVALFDLGPQKPARLVKVCHYLAADGMSWRILLEDLQAAYQQAARGEEIKLPPKTASFQSWAERLHQAARSEEVRGQLSYWLEESRSGAAALPVDEPGGENTEESARTVSASLTAEETAALLREVPAAYNTMIDEALLTALAQAVTPWAGGRSLLLDLESHGRADAPADVDASRTVGRLTHRAPLYLDLAPAGDVGSALKLVKEELRRFRRVSQSYGLLRYAGGDEEARRRLGALPQAELYFNYVGQLDQVASPAFSVKPSFEVLAGDRRLLGRRPYLLDVSAALVNGQLQFLWEYSSNLHRRPTVEALAQSFLDALRALIKHCQSPDVSGYTPSDFPSMDFDQSELDELMAKLSAR